MHICFVRAFAAATIKICTSAVVNPELERQAMEQLQNRIKTSSTQSTISGDRDL
jgi:hypothetical protein